MYDEVINLNTGDMFIGVGIFILLVVLARIVSGMCRPTLSHAYRKHLTNLYVAGRVRQRANKENVNLDEEEARCIIFDRKYNRRLKFRKEIDDKIEEQINFQIDKEIEEMEDSKTPTEKSKK